MSTRTPEPREALYAYLASDTTIAPLIGTNLFHGMRPMQVRPPLLVIQAPISRLPARILGGVAYRRTRLQLTAMGDTQLQVEAIVRAVIGAVDGYSGIMNGLDVMAATVDNDRQVIESEIGEVHHHIDVIMQYKG